MHHRQNCTKPPGEVPTVDNTSTSTSGNYNPTRQYRPRRINTPVNPWFLHDSAWLHYLSVHHHPHPEEPTWDTPKPTQCSPIPNGCYRK